VEILDLRHLSARDLDPLLEEEIELWRQPLLWDFHASADLIRRFLDSRSLPGYAAMENGRVAGYSFFVYEEHKGLIGDLFAVEAYRGQNQWQVEERLLDHVVETLKGSPGIQRIEAQLMMLVSEQVDLAFRHRQFRGHKRKFLYLDINGHSGGGLPPSRRPATDFVFEPWEERHFEEAASLITRAYRDHVDGAINDQYRSLSGALRFLRNIIQYPGCGAFHTGASIVGIHKATRRMQGLILTSTVNPGVGHITQVCTAPEFRNTGLGYELVRRATEIFREQRYTGISLTVTSANTHAIEFYERLGFRTLRDFQAYVWDSAWI
jgi:ribosomal protein S18 acetylase RimI-like enzyme